MNVEEKIIEAMDRVGMFVDAYTGSENTDIDLREYIHNSVQFISFVLELENAFDIALPDQYLLIDNFSSLRAAAANIEELLSNK